MEGRKKKQELLLQQNRSPPGFSYPFTTSSNKSTGTYVYVHINSAFSCLFIIIASHLHEWTHTSLMLHVDPEGEPYRSKYKARSMIHAYITHHGPEDRDIATAAIAEENDKFDDADQSMPSLVRMCIVSSSCSYDPPCSRSRTFVHTARKLSTSPRPAADTRRGVVIPRICAIGLSARKDCVGYRRIT